MFSVYEEVWGDGFRSVMKDEAGHIFDSAPSGAFKEEHDATKTTNAMAIGSWELFSERDSRHHGECIQGVPV